MKILPGWRYFRNLALLMLVGLVCLVALRQAYVAPIHWLWVLPLFYVGYGVWGAFAFAHPIRFRYWSHEIPRPDGRACEKVLFPSRDSLTLFGWYLPGTNRKALILAHGLGGAGIVMCNYAAFLAQAGYGVLMLDLRAHGSSDGDTSTYGVLEANDIAGATDFLLARGDVDKIGVLGISIGAQSALRGALICDSVGALVLEGLGPASIEDRIRSANAGERRKKLFVLWNRLLYGITFAEQWLFTFFSGQNPTPLTVESGKLAPRPLLLIACGAHEVEFNRRFCESAGQTCSLWELPKARHAAGLTYEPKEYPLRVVAFFDRALNVDNQ
ncbi:MAG: alpha/beta hydrolase [Anaerolineales bacterium]